MRRIFLQIILSIFFILKLRDKSVTEAALRAISIL